MPAQVVVVLREALLAGKTAEALTRAGYHAIAMTNSMVALQALEAATNIELLVTSTHFPGQQPNGLALARMTRVRRPSLKVIFADGPETKPHVARDGTFIATPTTPEAVVEAADELLRGSQIQTNAADAGALRATSASDQ